VFVVGNGMSKFHKPKKDPSEGPHFHQLAKVAVTRALQDATISPDLIEQAVVGCTSAPVGQRALYDMGMFNIPIYNVSNACSTGSNALILARQFVEGGLNECALAVGVEKMAPGPLGGGGGGGGPSRKDFNLPSMFEVQGKKFAPSDAPPNPQLFGNAGKEHMAKYGTTPEHFAMIGEKNHRHSVNNPYAQFRDVYSLEDIKNAPMIHDPLTKLQCSPTSDGSAACIVCSEDFVKKHGLEGQAVEIIGQSMQTDDYQSFDIDNVNDRTCIDSVGFPMASKAANEVYSQTGLSADDVQVVELHDCFSCNELLTYEALQLAEEGKGGELVESGNATYGGKFVINPSGGLISKGHPLGATGIAQCNELCWQLRGEAAARQVDGAKVALQHNLGLGGNCVITMYKRPDEWLGKPLKRAVSGAMGFDTEDVPDLDTLREQSAKL